MTSTAIRTVSAALVLIRAATASAQTFDAANDFSLASNPNGAWSYGWKPGLGGPFALFPGTGGCGVATWTTGAPLSVGKNLSSTAVCCATWSMPGYQMLYHPGNSGERATLRWTAPFAGNFGVSMTASGADFAYPTTTDVALEVNAALVSQQYINSYGNGAPCASNTYTPAISSGGSFILAAGGTIDVSVGFGSNGSYFGDATLVAVTITGPYTASSTPVGAGCGGGPAAPVLSCTPPVIGQNVTIAIANGTPLTSGGLFMSPPPAAPTPVGGGCTVYLDLATYQPLIQPITTDAAGNWSIVLGVPNDNALAGLSVMLQAALFPTAGPLGLDITNGVLVTAGF